MEPDAALSPVTPAPAPQLPTPQPSVAKKIFLAKDGLRPVWGMLIFFALIFFFFATAGFIAHLINPANRPGKLPAEVPLKLFYANEGLAAFVALLATWIMSRIERRGRSYGFAGTRKIPQLLAGMGSGIVLISLLVLTLRAGGWLVIDSRLIFGGAGILRYGVLWLLAFFLVGVFEESVTRGYLLFTLTRSLTRFYQWAFKTPHSATLGFWTSAFILSVIFLLSHTGNPGESPVGLLSVFLVGMVLCYSIWRTGSIWWAIGLHAAWDWGQSFVYGVADSGIMMQHHLLATHPQGRLVLSGGTTGPEGSILIVAVLALAVLVIRLTLPKGRYYDPPALPEPAVPEPTPPPAPVPA